MIKLLTPSNEEFTREYNAWLRATPQHIKELVFAVKRFYKAEWGDNWRSTIPVDELFEIVVDSSAVKLRKPDPAIYELTCAHIGVAPTASVFLDDNADNVAAARSLGMETVQVGEDPFEAVAELDAILDDLEAAGVRHVMALRGDPPGGVGTASAGPMNVNASGTITGFTDRGATFRSSIGNGSSDTGS